MKLTKSSGSDGEALNMMVETFRIDLKSLSEEYEEKDSVVESGDRAKLLNIHPDDDSEFNQSHKLTLKLIKTTDTLNEARVMGHDTVGVAREVLTDLDDQGKKN